MKKLFILIYIFFSSCDYPDIDSVPNFENINISSEELIDLCKMANSNKKNISECIDKINK